MCAPVIINRQLESVAVKVAAFVFTLHGDPLRQNDVI